MSEENNKNLIRIAVSKPTIGPALTKTIDVMLRYINVINIAINATNLDYLQP